MAIFTAAFSPFASHLKRSLLAGNPLLDHSALDAMKRLHAFGRLLTSLQISLAADHHTLVLRLQDARILISVPRPKGEQVCWTLIPYERALQSRRLAHTPSRA